MNKVTNTTREVIENPILGIFSNTEAIERRGQREIETSSQLPLKIGSRNIEFSDVVKEYKRHGIKVLKQSEGDKLFVDVILPDGWKIKGTDHSMWNELLDNNGRVRASFFYKAACYDRDAFLNFQSRYNINTVTHLPTEEKGHYEMRKYKVKIEPKEASEDWIDADVWGFRNMFGDRPIIEYYEEVRYETREEKVFIPKYKNTYEEYRNTPMYFEITDGRDVIYSSKDTPVYFKKKYQKNYHRKWWNEYEAARTKLGTDAQEYLNNNFPGWESTTKYF